MTNPGETVTQKGESVQKDLPGAKTEFSYCRVELEQDIDTIVEKREESESIDIQDTTCSLKTRGIQVWYTHRKVLCPQSTIVDYAESVVQLHFAVRSQTEYRAPGQVFPFAQIEQQKHNMFLLPASKIAIHWPAQVPFELIVITISPVLFFNYLPERHPVAQAFRRGLEEKVPQTLSNKGLPITSRMSTILHDLMHCELSACPKRLFIEAKIVELLALQLEQYEQLRQVPLLDQLKKEDVEKMHLVRDIMLANPGKTYSLKDLAHEVGTNEYNLKNHFKRVFGTTVFGYLQEYRMEQSKHILSRGEEKVSEVARMMGYKHATHFTAAFKKYFGFLPHQIRVME